MNRIIIACAVSLAIGLAAGLALRPANPPGMAAEGLAPTADLSASADDVVNAATRIRGSFHPLM